MEYFDPASGLTAACAEQRKPRVGTFEVIGKVLDELERARAKFPPSGNQHGAWAVVKEELDEAWDAVKKDHTISQTPQCCAYALHCDKVFTATFSGHFASPG